MLSIQTEEDVPTLNPDLDLINFATQDDDFPGKWTLSNFEKTVTVDKDELSMVVNRYMPKWKHDREE